MSCGVGHIRSLDPMLLWLWCRPAVALIRPLAWELPCDMGSALKSKKKKKRVNEFTEAKQLGQCLVHGKSSVINFLKNFTSKELFDQNIQ